MSLLASISPAFKFKMAARGSFCTGRALTERISPIMRLKNFRVYNVFK